MTTTIIKQQQIITKIRDKSTHQDETLNLLRNSAKRQHRLYNWRLQLLCMKTLKQDSVHKADGNAAKASSDRLKHDQIVSDMKQTVHLKRSNTIKSRQPVGNYEGPVAFHAKVSKYSVSHVGVNQKVVFDFVLSNIGNGYHAQQGVFIAPTAGIYLFSSSMIALGGGHFGAFIVKNDMYLANLSAYDEQAPGDQGSVTVVTQLATGDEVWVKIVWPADTSYRGDGYTSFTGCLIAVM